MEASTLFCSNCGVPSDEGASFCANCGVPIGNEPTAATVRQALASRESRLRAKLIDFIVYAGAIIVASTGFAGSVQLGVLLLSVAGLVIPIVQIALLARDGQTIGKKIVDIRIVSAKTGKNAGFGSNVVMRAWVNFLLGVIPFYWLVDVLFIFRDDQRCIHDLIASTRVVE